MKRLDTLYNLRLPVTLKAQCAVAAAKSQLHLSEWIRKQMQQGLRHK